MRGAVRVLFGLGAAVYRTLYLQPLNDRDSLMNTFILQRLTFLALLPLCTLIVIAPAAGRTDHRIDAPASTAPASAAPTPEDTRVDGHAQPLRVA